MHLEIFKSVISWLMGAFMRLYEQSPSDSPLPHIYQYLGQWHNLLRGAGSFTEQFVFIQAQNAIQENQIPLSSASCIPLSCKNSADNIRNISHS